MSAIAYHTTLPAPSQWQGVPRERRAASSSPGNTQLRNRSRDAVQDIEAQWFYTSAEMVIWRAWYETTLLNGMLWFAVTVPGAGGWVQRVAKFRTKTIKLDYVGGGVYRVSAQVQQRGISAAPVMPRGINVFSGGSGASGGTDGYTNVTVPVPANTPAGTVLMFFMLIYGGNGSDPPVVVTLSDPAWAGLHYETGIAGASADWGTVDIRIATGDANDQISYTSTVPQTNWVLLTFTEMNDPRFPSIDLGKNLSGMAVGSADTLGVVMEVILSPSPGGAFFVGPPAGYTEAAEVSFPRAGYAGHNNYKMQMMVAYKFLPGGGTVDGVFDIDVSGGYSGGSSGNMLIGYRY